MLARMWMFLRELIDSFRIADGVDIVVIAIILYWGLIWLRETASRRVAIGITALAALYFAALTFDLYLTSQLLHAGFAVVLIVLVVAFQEELRHFFERIAAMGSLRALRAVASDPEDLDIVVKTAFGFAARHVGALLVVKGQDDLARHLYGGVPLKGQLSGPLLESIFDPSSAGHDGAVVLEDGTVRQFASHLPISKNRQEIRHRGTRHAAALGLSEESDALVIVVSEERGVVSVAERGLLREVSSPAALKGRLEKFETAKFPPQKETVWKRLVARHWQFQILAVGLAVIGWMLFAYNPSTVQRTFVVPIEYRNIPAPLVLDEFAPTETRVTLSGTEPAFRMFQPSDLRISIDMAGAHEGFQSVQIDSRSLNVPPKLEVYRIQNGTMSLILRPRAAEGANHGGVAP